MNDFIEFIAEIYYNFVFEWDGKFIWIRKTKNVIFRSSSDISRMNFLLIVWI